MLGFEPIGTEPIGSHYTASGLWPGTWNWSALRVTLRAAHARIKVTLWRLGPRG